MFICYKVKLYSVLLLDECSKHWHSGFIPVGNHGLDDKTQTDWQRGGPISSGV